MRGIVIALVLLVGLGTAEERTEHFDADPQWDGVNNRGERIEKRHVIQDFGYAGDKEIDGKRGAIGGTICPDGHAAYYAMTTDPLDLTKSFSAKGKVLVENGSSNTLLGFFNSQTVNEWRTPNAIMFRINARGDVFHVHYEFATSKWRATAGVIGTYNKQEDRMYPVEFPAGGVHTWSLTYSPSANGSPARLRASFDSYTSETEIPTDLLSDGASMDRFGLLNVIKHTDSYGNLWMNDLEVIGKAVDLARDPQWTMLNNHADFLSDETRPRFNFGYSDSQFAGGSGKGEIGGLFFRGDCRDARTLAYYGARLEPLTLTKPLKASGKLVLRRAVSDSTTLFGFFNATESVKVTDSQQQALPMDFVGFSIEGPSAQGFYVYPSYRTHNGAAGTGEYGKSPHIYPDSVSHDWTLEYAPAQDGSATLSVTLDGIVSRVSISADDVNSGTTLNRFGFVTPWIDGNGQVVYLDDLRFTAKQ